MKKNSKIGFFVVSSMLSAIIMFLYFFIDQKVINKEIAAAVLIILIISGTAIMFIVLSKVIGLNSELGEKEKDLIKVNKKLEESNKQLRAFMRT